MIEIRNLDKNYFGKELLKNVSLSIPEGIIGGVVGINGSGKSTFFQMIIGKEKSDNGVIKFTKKDIQIGYMKQEIAKENENILIIDYIKNEVGVLNLEKRLRELEKDLSNEENFQKYSEIYEKFENKGGYSIEYEINNILEYFGFNIEVDKRKISELSEGQKSKVLLSIAIFQGKDLLILDEPTNNLDIDSINYLTGFLKKSGLTILLVSHDRSFLDELCNKIYEIDHKSHNILEYNGNYTFFENYKKEKFDREMLEYEVNSSKIKDLKIAIEEAKNRVSRTQNSKKRDNDKFQDYFFLEATTKGYGSKINSFSKKIEDMNKLEKPQKDKKINYILNDSKNFGFIRINDLKFKYKNSSFSLEVQNFEAFKRDRIGVIGKNGSGKTTFLEILNGKITPNFGEIFISKSIKIGNFIGISSNLDNNMNSIELISKKGNISELEANKLLGIFNLDTQERYKKIGLLSPGQRVKLIFTLFKLYDYNTLILDEPTNHLDIEGIKVIENALNDFDGILIVVSHDKRFMEELSFNKIYEINEGKMIENI